MPELGLCECGGRLAEVPQTWPASPGESIPTLQHPHVTASPGDSIPILAAGTQGTVKRILALGLSHCLGVPLVAGSLVTCLLLLV